MIETQTQATSPHVALQWCGEPRGKTPIRRFVVLLPDADVNEALLARMLWMLSTRENAGVHLVAKVEDWAREGQVNLRLSLIESLLRETGIEFTTHLELNEADWLRIAETQACIGDVIVCHTEQKVPARNGSFGIEISPLSRQLAKQHWPVCELSGFILTQPRMTAAHLVRTWGLPVAIIATSFLLEVLFMSWARNWAGWARQAVLAFYTSVELASIAWLAKK